MGNELKTFPILCFRRNSYLFSFFFFLYFFFFFKYVYEKSVNVLTVHILRSTGPNLDTAHKRIYLN